MEHAQRGLSLYYSPLPLVCLNPYFNGTCSKSEVSALVWTEAEKVLILILMEHAQRGLVLFKDETFLYIVLILILMEHAQREHFL